MVDFLSIVKILEYFCIAIRKLRYQFFNNAFISPASFGFE